MVDLMSYPDADAPVALGRNECFRLLRQVPVGRIGVSIDALPVVLPLQFLVEDESVLVQTIRGTKLDAAVLGSVVAFQADAADAGAGTHWSVMVQGIAAESEDGPGQQVGGIVGGSPWVRSTHDRRWVSIDATLISGRLFRLGDGWSAGVLDG